MPYPLLNDPKRPFQPAVRGAAGVRRQHADPEMYRVVPFEEEYGDSGPLLNYWRLLVRHKSTIVLVAFAGTVAAILLTLPQTPVYRAKTSLEIQDVNENFMNMRNVTPTAHVYAPEYDLRTQTRILESRSLLERVLGNHPDLQRRMLAGGQQGRLAMWAAALGVSNSRAGNDTETACTTLQNSLQVRAQPNTRVIDVSIDSSDPQLAADLANAFAAEFVETSLQERWQTTQHTSEWLARQMHELKVKLEKAEEELQEYARSSDLVFTGEKNNVAEDRLRQLQEELSKAQADRVAKQSRYELALRGHPEALPDVMDDPTLKDYQIELTTLRRQLAELTASFTPEHPKVKKVEAQIAAVETAIDSKRSRILSRVRNDFESAHRREQLLAADYGSQVRLMSAQADKVTHYNILKREVDTTRQLYDSMFQRVKEAGLAAALRASNIQVIDPAERPRLPYKPRLLLNAALGLFFGFWGGIALVAVRDRSDRRIQAPGDCTLYLNVPELGVIPSDEAERRKGRTLPRGSDTEPANGGAQRLELSTWQRRFSPVAEAFRVTLTSILFSGQNDSHPQLLVISSASAEEGKTTTTSNLAIGLAQAGQRVLAIDGDIRRPRLHNIFEIGNEAGLSDILAGKTLVAVRETKVPNLFLLPSGSSTDSNLLFTPVLRELVGRLRNEFDIILIDTPPLLAMPDARVLGRHADAVVLVVRAHQTSRDAARLACARLEEDGIPVLGTILTDWNSKNVSAYGYQNYQSAYRSYGAAGDKTA